MKKLILILLMPINILVTLAQEGYPKPTANDVLFYIQHSRGTNTFIYQANYDSPTKLNDKEPVKISRQLFDKNGEIKPITNVQRKYAYGLRIEKARSNQFVLELVSYPDQKLYLKTDKYNKPYVETNIAGKQLRVNRIFIKLKDDTSGFNVKAEFIIFYGIDKSGKAVQEKLII